MRGSVYRRKGAKTWTIGYDTRYEDGQRVRKVEGGFRTKRAAQETLNDRLHHLHRGEDPLPEKITLDAYLNRWLERHRSEVRPETHERYVTLLRERVRPVVGSVQLTKIKPGHVREVMDAMLSSGSSPATVRQMRACWGAAMRQAVADGLITYNPVSAVRPPKLETPELSVPEPAQLRALLSEAQGTVWEVPLLLAMSTGARRSEVLGLRWSDVDLNEGRVTFQRGLHRGAKGEFYFLEPKTKRGKRTVALYPDALERLRRHRAGYLERRLALGRVWQDTDAVCHRGDGGLLDPDTFTKSAKKLMLEAGLPAKTRLHDIRHAVATELAHSQIHSVIVSQMLGHQSPAFTASVYQHAWREGADQAAVALGDRMGTAAKLQPKNPQ